MSESPPSPSPLPVSGNDEPTLPLSARSFPETRLGRRLAQAGALPAGQELATLTSPALAPGVDLELQLAEVLVQQRLLGEEVVRDHLLAAGVETVICPQCTTGYAVKDWRAGRAASCPTCAPGAGPALVPAAVAPPASGVAFDRYQLLEELGRGGMGRVWKAWDTRLERIVALKELHGFGGRDPELEARFEREARLAARLRHPHIVTVYDVGAHAGRHFLTCEYVEGTPLSRALSPLPDFAQSAAWVRAVAEALACAHDLGVVHRDIKPGNILLDADRRPHVADFGLAKQLQETFDPNQPEPLTTDGQLLGTPTYMSPEQANGMHALVGPASDQFSLGVVLYELLTGRVPFQADSVPLLLARILSADPEAPRRHNPRIPTDLETICLRTLEKSPLDRYPHVRALAEDLARFLAGEPIAARPLSLPRRWARRLARHRKFLLAPAALLIVILALVTHVWTSSRATALRIDQLLVEARAERAAADAALARPGGRHFAHRHEAIPHVAGALERYRGILALDADHAEARAGRAWAEAELAQEAQARDTAERLTALTLEKTRQVADVFRRWTRLVPIVAAFDEAAHDSARSDADRTALAARHAPAVADFLRSTPADDASQATAGALAGWLDYAAGARDAGLQRMREAATRDPDVPYGALMEALALLSEYISGQAMPGYLTGPTGLTFRRMPEEPPALRELRNRIAALRERVTAARIWGREGGEVIGEVLQALDTLLQGDAAAAAAGLGRAIEAPDFQFVETVLRLARGRLYCVAGNFDAAEPDLAAVRQAWPGFALGHWLSALVPYAQALALDWRTVDPDTRVDTAEAHLRRAMTLEPAHVWYRNSLGNLQLLRGRIEQARGRDARAAYRTAIETYSAALDDGLPPELRLMLLGNRGQAWMKLGGMAAVLRLDPVPDFRQAIADLSAVLTLRPEDVVARSSRGLVTADLAATFANRGEDPATACRDALPDLDAWLTTEPAAVEGLERRGAMRWLLGRTARAQRLDPTADFAAALADFEAALKADPQAHDVRRSRGQLSLDLATEALACGRDPSEAWRQAITDLDHALSRSPDSVSLRVQRGTAHAGLGERATATGGDPREHDRAALADFAAALRLAPDHDDAGRRCWDLCRRLGEAEETRRVDPRAAYRQGVAYVEQRLALRPDDAEALDGRGHLWAGIARAEAAAGEDPRATGTRAIECFGALLTRGLMVAHVRGERGRVCLMLAQHTLAHGADARPELTLAVEEFTAALAADPDLADAWRLRAYLHSLLGQADASAGEDPRPAFARALADLEEWLRRRPTDAEGLSNRASLHAMFAQVETTLKLDPRARLRQADAAYVAALQQRPGDVDLHVERGQVLSLLAEAGHARDEEAEARDAWTRARTEFEAALAAQPEHLPALVGLGLTCEALHDFATAATVLEAATRLDPADAELRNFLDRVRRAGR